MLDIWFRYVYNNNIKKKTSYIKKILKKLLTLYYELCIIDITKQKHRKYLDILIGGILILLTCFIMITPLVLVIILRFFIFPFEYATNIAG